MLGVILSLVVTAVMVRYLLKRFKAQFALFAAGLVLLAAALAMHAFGLLPSADILPKKVASTGFWGFDLFKCISSLFSSRVAGLGMIIMAAAAYSRYMSLIGASAHLADLMSRPLRAFKSPYVVLALSYIVGQLMNIFIPSASGLAMLLMVTMYPVLVRLGVSPLSAAALIATSGCLDLGPASGNANLAAKNGGLDPMVYAIDYQLPVACCVAATISVLHYFTQKYFDGKDGDRAWKAGDAAATNESAVDTKGAPVWYAVLPTLPLVLLFIFSKFLVSSIKLDVPTAMMACFALAMVCECFRHPVKEVFDKAFEFFNAMGKQFAAVVTLIVAGEVFAQGLIATGAVKYLISATQSLGLPGTAIMIVMVVFISVVSVVMGSGNAPFFAFAPLVPGFAKELGVSTMLLILPMQFATSLARTVSPITAVVVAVAGASGISPFEIIRRTAIPMFGGLAMTVIATVVLF
ncbi:MAG: C4-dicarboxylate transporter DcuC [Duodenibacillus sp.]|nr:C4-dicarboxylate transporter DcuC [Duodenibacillus sp.]